MATWDPRANDLFLRALELRSGTERRQFLDRACAEDASFRAQVESLLEASERAGSFLERPAALVGTVDEPPASEGCGTIVGPYKLLEPIGEGGMGTVYMAQQARPVRRLVALKLIKAGMDSKQVIARFEAERQALALMDHPNIAKVLDAGGTESGRPYFVMELVKGVPLTRYCDEHKLTPRQRLELFVPVCHAIQHAHQKGIIHRDLKPSNVLVAPYDGVPVPKVIDFGIAKATGQQLTDRTLVTGFGAVVGTLEYMSPEQAELNQLDVDTRSDIYSLGVLLYELLTGTTPLQKKRLNESSLLEALRLIREEEPPKPSTRLSTAKELVTLAASRGLEPTKLNGVVRGELDWIVMKCLEKDRGRRYETANGLALDIQHYLRDEPVQACPPSAAYRLQKLVRRYRQALAMAGVVLVGLVLAVVSLAVSTVLTSQTLAQERQALYFQRIALAERELAENNLPHAEELLGLCPPALRRWEWHYLKRSRGRPPAELKHPHAVSGKASLSRDGKKLATAGSNGVVTVWDLAAGTHRLIPAHAASCWNVAISPDGRTVASANETAGGEPGTGEVRFWDTESGKEAWPAWKLGDRYVTSLAFCPDGRRLAVTLYTLGKEEEWIEIRDVPSGRVQAAPPGHVGSLHGLAFSPDGRLLASAGHDEIVRVSDSHTGRVVHEFRDDLPERVPYWSVAFSPDGRRLAAGYGIWTSKDPGGARVWDVATGRQVASLSGHTPHAVAFSADGRLATGGMDGTAGIWDAERGQELLTLRGHTSYVASVAFTPDGHRLVTVSEDRRVCVWDATPLRDGEDLGEERFTLTGHADCVNTLAFHPTRPLLATGSSDGTVRLWDTRTGSAAAPVFLQGLDEVQAVAYDAAGERLAVVGFPTDRCGILDARTGELRVKLEMRADEVCCRLAFSRDGRLLAGCDYSEGFIQVWDARTGKVRCLSGHRGPVGVAFGPDARPPAGIAPLTPTLLVTVARDGEVRVWDPASGQVVKVLEHPGARAVAFSPDGSRMATAGWDGVVRVWDPATWKVVEQVHDPSGWPNSVAFSPDGKRVAWGGTGASVKVWELGSGNVKTLRGHRNWVWDVAFSPEGDVLASASRDGTVKIWSMPSFEKK